MTGHPLTRYERELQLFATSSISDLPELMDGEPVRLGGIITHVKTTNDRKGERMAFVTIEDFTGRVELVVFSSCYAKRHDHIRRDLAVIVEGKVSTREDADPKIVVSDVVPLASAYQRFVERVVVSLSSPGLEEAMIEEIKGILLEHPGRCPVELEVHAADEVVTVGAGGIRVEPTRTLVERLEAAVGRTNVQLVGSATGSRVPDPAF